MTALPLLNCLSFFIIQKKQNQKKYKKKYKTHPPRKTKPLTTIKSTACLYPCACRWKHLFLSRLAHFLSCVWVMRRCRCRCLLWSLHSQSVSDDDVLFSQKLVAIYTFYNSFLYWNLSMTHDKIYSQTYQIQNHPSNFIKNLLTMLT